MRLSEYQTLAQRTASKQTTGTLRLAVAGLGLAGEAAEVLDLIEAGTDDTPKMVKELGDVMWYVADTASVAGLALDEVVIPASSGDEDRKRLAIRLTIRAGMLADYLKKVVGHNHPLDQERVTAGLGDLIRLVTDVAAQYHTDLATVCERNIDKLRIRYPDGFSSERSLHRADGG